MRAPVRLYVQPISGRPAAGADGLVRATHEAARPDLSLDLLRVVTAVAARTYAFTPDDNHGYRHEFPGVEWSWSALSVESYGVIESMGAAIAREIRIHRQPPARDVAALAIHLLSSGYPPVVQLAGAPSVFGVAVAVESPRGAHRCRDATLAEDCLTFDPVVSPDAVLPMLQALIPIRPATEAPAGRRRALVLDALRFAVDHARGQRELDFSEELYFASGLRALDVAARQAGDPSLVGGDEWDRFWSCWTADLAAGRRSMGAVLEGWARAPSDAPTAADWGAAAAAYANVAACAEEVREAPDRAAAATLLPAMREADARAIAALHACVGRD